MIHILVGNDTKKKRARINAIAVKAKPIFIPTHEVSIELLTNYASSVSLFGESSTLVMENMLGQEDLDLSSAFLDTMHNSPTIFILLEDKLLAASEKKYTKYATIEKFLEKSSAPLSKTNNFAIADAFGRRDKIGAWISYRDAIEAGAEPEMISGMLFWKIKNMILTGNKVFTLGSLKKQSSDLVSLYHRAHRGESDFVIGLEQFILSALSN